MRLAIRPFQLKRSFEKACLSKMLILQSNRCFCSAPGKYLYGQAVGRKTESSAGKSLDFRSGIRQSQFRQRTVDRAYCGLAEARTSGKFLLSGFGGGMSVSVAYGRVENCRYGLSDYNKCVEDL